MPFRRPAVLSLLSRLARRAAWALGLAAASSAAAATEPKTVCTVTINSPDERDSFQRHLPPANYRFVELVQRGQADWLNTARQQGVRCDVLVISGHFDDGTEFYTDRFDDREFLTVHEMQRTACSASGDGLFSQLKEVYLFGCNTLQSMPRHVAPGEVLRSLEASGRSSADAQRLAAVLSERYGQSNRDRLRHVFKDVPVLYGFSSKAPLGRYAGPLLERYFKTAPAGEIGSGVPSPTLLSLFGPSSMVAVAGLTDTDPHAGFRQDLCTLADDRRPKTEKITFLHQLLQRDPSDVRMLLELLEQHASSITPALRQQAGAAAALRAIEGDQRSRERFLALARDADDSAVQARMMALARTLGWLTPAQEQAELLHLLAQRMARGKVGATEVDLACTARPRHEPVLAQRLIATGAPQAAHVSHAAVLACLGSPEGHRRTVHALTSVDETDLEIAQAYLRHRPLSDLQELRALTTGIARMGTATAQVRALETLAKQRLADAQSLQEIAGLFPRARSLEVQRAIAGILIRADYHLLEKTELARALRQHRLKSPDGSDVIDMLIRLLQTAA